MQILENLYGISGEKIKNDKTEKKYNDLIKKKKKLSLYDIDEIAEYGDRLITLSTCTYYTEDGRFVVVGRERSNL